MLVLNFSHPLLLDQCSQIEILINQKIEEIIEIPVHFNHNCSFTEQINKLVGCIELTSSDWQTKPILINPPSFAPISVVLLAELHGRMGYFPPCLRLAPVKGSIPPTFEVLEILDLQKVREEARQRR
ncbi:MAG: hypothetical protein C4589_08685 [Peptococcaceae bacterium]|nr:MAG: hypothetical protein C4589_08685 [Peptococcaceae bacterium]